MDVRLNTAKSLVSWIQESVSSEEYTDLIVKGYKGLLSVSGC